MTARRLKGWLLGLCGLWALWVLGTLTWAFVELRSGQSSVQEARRLALSGDAEGAKAQARRAVGHFDRGRTRLGSSVLFPLRPLPGVGTSIHAVEDLAGSGGELVAAAIDDLGVVRPSQLVPSGGRLPLDRVRVTEGRLDRFRTGLDEISVQAGRDPGWVLPPVASARRRFLDELRRLEVEVGRAQSALGLLRTLVGENRPRSVLLLFQNPAELRATGGLIGSWAVATADQGALDLVLVDRINRISSKAGELPRRTTPADDTFGEAMMQAYQGRSTVQNINMSPSFPEVARTLLSVYNPLEFPDVDEVIALDTAALPALVQLSGPLVTGDGTRITPENVIDATGLDAYGRLTRPGEREEFLAEVVTAVWNKLVQGAGGDLDEAIPRLGAALAERHLMVFSADPSEQQRLEELGVAGEWPDPGRIGFGWVTQNVAANKVDLFLSRRVDIELHFGERTGKSASPVRPYAATVTLDLHNDAPTSGYPRYVLGPYVDDGPLGAGDNLQLVSVFSPSGADGLSVDGRRVSVRSNRMGDWLGHTAGDVLIRHGSRSRVSFDVSGVVPNVGCVRVPLVAQPSRQSDRVRLTVRDSGGGVIARIDHRVSGVKTVDVPTVAGGCPAG